MAWKMSLLQGPRLNGERQKESPILPFGSTGVRALVRQSLLEVATTDKTALVASAALLRQDHQGWYQNIVRSNLFDGYQFED